MTTQILNLPSYGFDITVSNREDLRASWAYVDDKIAGVTIYGGGASFPGGPLPVYFSSPASGLGHPAVGTATVVSGVVTAIAVNDTGAGYDPTELVTLTIPGAGVGLIASVQIGNAVSLAGITLDFEVRKTATDPSVILLASTTTTVGSLPVNGTVVTSGNILGLMIVEAQMRRIAAGAYVYEVKATADSATLVAATGKFIVTEGIARVRD